MEDGRTVVGVMYPAAWEERPREELEVDLQRLSEVDPRIEIVDVRYVEPDELRARRGADPTADLRSSSPPLTAEQREAFARIEIALAQDLPFNIGQVAPRLRWVQGMGAGVSQLTSAGLGAAGVRLTSAAGVNAVSISEFVVARLLEVWKRLPAIGQAQSNHEWIPLYGREVAGSQLGIVGLGAIGRRVASLGRALGMRVVGSRRSATAGAHDPDVDVLYGVNDLYVMLNDCDAIVCAVPESTETIGLFSTEEFRAMKQGGVFCNVGRGSLVDETSLIAALDSGHLGAAVLDVVGNEPLPADSPLWDVPRLHLSAHCATSADRFWSNLHALFRSNLTRYLEGKSLRNEMDLRSTL